MQHYVARYAVSSIGRYEYGSIENVANGYSSMITSGKSSRSLQLGGGGFARSKIPGVPFMKALIDFLFLIEADGAGACVD